MTSVKFFHSRMTGISTIIHAARGASFSNPPHTITNTALFDVISKVFVTGFNTQNVLSINVTSNVATVTFSVAHGFEDHCVVLISGANTSAINGEKRITVTSATAFTFTTTGVADGAVSGTITAKYAPLGWSYIGTTPTTLPILIRSVDETGTQCAFQFNNFATGEFSGGISIAGYRTSNTTQALNLFATRSLGYNGPISQNTYNTTHWIIVGDTKTFYILYNGAVVTQGLNLDNNSGFIIGGGVFSSIYTVDPYATFVAGETSSTVPPSITSSLGYSNTSSTNVALAATGGGGSSPVAYSAIEFPIDTAGYLGANLSNVAGSGYPNAGDSSLILCRRAIGDGTLRGYFRGLYQSPQNCAASFNPLDRVEGQGALSGRKLLAVKNGASGTANGAGVSFFDITGPWG